MSLAYSLVGSPELLDKVVTSVDPRAGDSIVDWWLAGSVCALVFQPADNPVR